MEQPAKILWCSLCFYIACIFFSFPISDIFSPTRNFNHDAIVSYVIIYPLWLSPWLIKIGLVGNSKKSLSANIFSIMGVMLGLYYANTQQHATVDVKAFATIANIIIVWLAFLLSFIIAAVLSFILKIVER